MIGLELGGFSVHPLLKIAENLDPEDGTGDQHGPTDMVQHEGHTELRTVDNLRQ